MDKSFYLFVTLLSGFCIMPSIAIVISNIPSIEIFMSILPAKPHETTVPEAPDVEITPTTKCTFRQLEPRDVIQEKGKLLIKNHNLTLPINQQYVFDPILNLCFTRSETLKKEIFDNCMKWEYNGDEFSVLQNGSVQLFEIILEPGSYAIKDGILQTCVDDSDNSVDSGNRTRNTKTRQWVSSQVSDLDNWSIYIGQVGSSISIIALTAHLVSFCLVPTVRNLPGYNLASLSVAFLLGYLFSLIGQIPQVLGLFCVISGILEQFFFLTAFFCMNTLAFDVWRTISMAANKLAFFSTNNKRRHFIYYSIYSWGTPLLITATTVSLDNVEGVPKSMRPGFGKHDICYMTNNQAKIIFFSAPAFTLFVINGIFFVMCAFLVKKNTMKCTSEELRQTARNNFVLYFRLGMMMGLTWLFGIVAMFSDNSIVWMVFDFMNSLQGLFVFLLFTCSKKVFAHVREKLNIKAAFRTPKTSMTDITTKTEESGYPGIRKENPNGFEH